MDIQEIIDELASSEKALQALQVPWARAKALHEMHDDMKKVRLSMATEKHTGTDQKRKALGQVDPDYVKYLEETKFNIDKDYFEIEAKKQGLEIHIDILKTHEMKSYV